MRVAITGSSGLIGNALVDHLRGQGHEPVRVVRDNAKDSEIGWDPTGGSIDATALAACDAVVNLAGEPIGVGRWTDEKKRKIRASRVEGTSLIATTLAGLDDGPKILVNASAVGFYGDRGDQELTEDSGPGTGFLADLVRDWEAATVPAVDAGVRVVLCRNGIVLSPDGGALGKILPLFKLGAGGKLGSGQQYWPWISIDDTVGLLMLALEDDRISGPLNVSAPVPVTNAEFTSTLGSELGRPTLLPAPAFGVRLVMGSERADEMLFTSQRMVPRKALDIGYQFAHPGLRKALKALLGKD